MAMTYYAVTDDPNELAHWGIKGMKWGVRHDKPRHPGSSRPRSIAYKKAQNKLGQMMKSGIKKAEAKWQVYNSPAAKYERQTNKAIEKARKGKLKYGKLTDDQVRRVTERLNLERQARELSSKEQTFMRRLGQSVSQGIITGVGQGFGNIAAEKISRGSKLKTDRMRAEQQDEFDRRKENRRIRNAEKQANKKIVRDQIETRVKDKYEHNRDQKYEKERLKNLYDYGASYTSDGKLDTSDPAKLEAYYRRRYLDGGETRSASYARQRRELASTQKKEERARRKSEADMRKATAIAVKNRTAGYGSAWDPFSDSLGRSMKGYMNGPDHNLKKYIKRKGRS